jgi:hypothetical protein
LYQRFIAPPGDRLLKWMLAGIYEPDRKSFLSDLIHQYADRSVLSVFANKLFNIENLFSPWSGGTGSSLTLSGSAGLATSVRRVSLPCSGPLPRWWRGSSV